MDAIKGGTRHVNLDLGHPVGQREVEVQIPAGVSNGQQLLIENAVQAKNLRVSLMVQVRSTIQKSQLRCPKSSKHSRQRTLQVVASERESGRAVQLVPDGIEAVKNLECPPFFGIVRISV
jgi:hypothetical protein